MILQRWVERASSGPASRRHSSLCLAIHLHAFRSVYSIFAGPFLSFLAFCDFLFPAFAVESPRRCLLRFSIGFIILFKNKINVNVEKSTRDDGNRATLALAIMVISNEADTNFDVEFYAIRIFARKGIHFHFSKSFPTISHRSVVFLSAAFCSRSVASFFLILVHHYFIQSGFNGVRTMIWWHLSYEYVSAWCAAWKWRRRLPAANSNATIKATVNTHIVRTQGGLRPCPVYRIR